MTPASNRLPTDFNPSDRHTNRYANRLPTPSDRVFFLPPRTPLGWKGSGPGPNGPLVPPRHRLITNTSHVVTDRALLIPNRSGQRCRMKQLAQPKANGSVVDRRISRAVRHGCELLLSGECKTIKAAAERANLSREHLSKSLKLPHVQTFCEQRIRQNLGTAQMRASNVLAELMDGGKSEHVRKDIARYFTELAGYVVQANAAPAVHINNSLLIPGYHIDLGQHSQVIEHSPAPRAPRDDPAAAPVIEHTATAEPSTVVPWRTVRPVGRG